MFIDTGCCQEHHIQEACGALGVSRPTRGAAIRLIWGLCRLIPRRIPDRNPEHREKELL
jgi:hypothetical protein